MTDDLREPIDKVEVRSLARPSALRLGADILAAGFALVSGVIVARNLGPTGKGAVSTLSYLVALAWPAAALGLGEAGVAVVARGSATLERATRSTITVLLASTAVTAPIVLAVSTIPALGLTAMRGGRYAAALCVPLTTFSMVLPLFAEYRQRFAMTALVRATIGGVTAVATLYFVVDRSLSVFGAVLAMAVGTGVGCVVLLLGFRRAGLPVLPGWDEAYVRLAIRAGLPVQVGLLAVVGAARADVLVLAALRDAGEVGVYSVALSVAQLVTLAPVAVAAAAIPRIASAQPDSAHRHIVAVLRIALVLALGSALFAAALSPWVVPLLFGEGFRDAVVPLLLLLPGSVLNALQWVAARSSAARGRTRAFARTFSVTLASMIVLDLVLVRRWGAPGAAVAASVAWGVGTVVALRDVVLIGDGRQIGWRAALSSRHPR